MNSFRKDMIIPVAGFCIILLFAGCTPGKAQTRGNDYKGSFQNEEFETFDPGSSNWDDRIPPYDGARRGSDDQRYNNSSRNNSGDYKNESSSYNDRDSRVGSNSYSDSPARSDFQQNPYGGSNDARGGFVKNSGMESNEFREDRFFQKGYASWYGREFHGKITASGERFDMNQLTAAHKTLPFGSIVEVRNLENGKSVRLKINDRGPYRGNRIIDVSYEAARALDMVKSGEASVGINVIHMGDNSTAHQSNTGTSYVEPVSDRGLPLNVNRYDSASRYESSQSYSSGVKLQAGAFYSRRNAENLRDRVQSMTDMPVKVIQDGDFYKVRVEGLQSKYEADRLKNSLYNSNISSFVVE
jgi:rare lipoprotein A